VVVSQVHGEGKEKKKNSKYMESAKHIQQRGDAQPNTGEIGTRVLGAERGGFKNQGL